MKDVVLSLTDLAALAGWFNTSCIEYACSPDDVFHIKICNGLVVGARCLTP